MKSMHACLACSTLLINGPAFAYGNSNGTATASPSKANKTSPGTGVSGFVAAGAGVAPAFEGTDEYEAIPFFFGDVHRYIARQLGPVGIACLSPGFRIP